MSWLITGPLFWWCMIIPVVSTVNYIKPKPAVSQSGVLNNFINEITVDINVVSGRLYKELFSCLKVFHRLQFMVLSTAPIRNPWTIKCLFSSLNYSWIAFPLILDFPANFSPGHKVGLGLIRPCVYVCICVCICLCIMCFCVVFLWYSIFNCDLS